jgi:hypothetical protein
MLDSNQSSQPQEVLMLAQNFKTADDLCISIAEHGALIQVLGMLERGELIHADTLYGPSSFNKGLRSFKGLHMGMTGSSCGTVACIGGWVASILGIDQRDYVNGHGGSNGLKDLYLVKQLTPFSLPLYKITADQAAIALRSYLTTGNANWDLALKE